VRPAQTLVVQVELASERELRQRTEADASEASQRSERQISELSQALAAAAADVTAARQAFLESEARAEAQQVGQTSEQVQHMTCIDGIHRPSFVQSLRWMATPLYVVKSGRTAGMLGPSTARARPAPSVSERNGVGANEAPCISGQPKRKASTIDMSRCDAAPAESAHVETGEAAAQHDQTAGQQGEHEDLCPDGTAAGANQVSPSMSCRACSVDVCAW